MLLDPSWGLLSEGLQSLKTVVLPWLIQTSSSASLVVGPLPSRVRSFNEGEARQKFDTQGRVTSTKFPFPQGHFPDPIHSRFGGTAGRQEELFSPAQHFWGQPHRGFAQSAVR